MYLPDDKVRIRRLKDMQCEFDTPSSQYDGNVLILRDTRFTKDMVAYCGRELFVRDALFCNDKLYRLETNYGYELPLVFEEYMLERCDKNVRGYTEEDLEELDNQLWV